MASFTENLKAKGISNGALTFTQKLDKRIAEDKAEQAKRAKTLTNLSKGPSYVDPVISLPPQQRDQAEQARRSKMGTTKNTLPEPVQTPQPIQQPTQSPYRLPESVSSAINTSTGLLSGLLKKASPQTSQAVNIAGKLTQPVAEQAVKVGAHGLSAGAEGVIRGMNNIVNLSSMGSEGLYNLLGIDMPAVSKEQREKDRQATEKWVGDIRSDLGVDPNKMSGAGNLLYNTATNIPQMLAGPVPFALSAAGGYAQDAEQKGASLGQSLAHGLVGGGTELMLESALGAVPGIKNLKNITKGGIKGFLKTAAGEALEEAITDPLTKLSEKAIFNKKLPWYSKTEDAVINPSQMGQSALGGGLMATMLAPFGLGGNVRQVDSQTQTTPIEPILKPQPTTQAQQQAPIQQTQNRRLSVAEIDADAISQIAKMTKEEFLSVLPNGYKYEPNTQSTTAEASNRGNEIVLRDKFFDLPEDGRRAVLAHEMAHNIEPKILDGNADLVMALFDYAKKNEPYYGVNKNANEVLADGIKDYVVNPEWQKKTYPKMYSIVEQLLNGNTDPNKIVELKEYIMKPAEGKPMTKKEEQLQIYDDVIAQNPELAKQKGWDKKAEELRREVKRSQPAPIGGKAQQEFAPIVEQQPRQESPILQKRRQAEQLRKEYEQIKATSKLTPDELTIAENIRKGKLSAVPQGFNTQIINEVANAGRLYDQADGEVKAFNENRKQAYRDTFDTLLANSDKWKDKDLFGGARYSREIQERNIIDIAGQEDGQKIADVVFAPTHVNEAKRNQSNTEYRNRIRQYKLSDKVHGLVKEIDVGGKKYKQINERAAAQMLLEKKLTENEIPASMDKNKVIAAAKELRKSYDELFALANEVRVNNGYAPIGYRKDYAPHFEDPKDPFVKMLKSMGFKVDDMELSTDIAGITHQFRPGTKFFSHFLRREGNTTDYDALEGFDKYLEGISDVIYHTEDIQRLRAFETAIRTKHADSNIKNRIAEIEASGLSQEEKQAAIDELFDNNRGHLGAYVTDLREYTNNLAGKKSISDRNMEHNLKRKMYNVMDNLTNQMAKGMISFNIGSALTNIISLTQGGAGISTKNFFKAFNDTVANHWQDDGFVNRSTFLTNRKGSEPLTKTAIEKAIDVGMKPMELTDWLTSSIIVRGMYLDGIERGLSPTEAMKKADSYAARAIGDRSKGATPTAFNKKNPVSRLLTTFQLEVNNQLSFLFKDLPREGKELGSKWLAATIFKFLFGSYLFNQAYEFLTGRRPALDPVGAIKKAIEAETPSEGFANIKKNVFGQLPFVGGYLEGGRLPINAALPDFQKMGEAGKNILDGNGNFLKNAGDFAIGALKNPATYLLSPIGGGGQAKKTIEGLKAFGQGASLSDTGRMRYPIPKTLPNALRTGLFGQYSTPEAREYFDKNRTTLSPNQTQQVMSSEDPQQAYLRIMQERQINSLNQKIKDVAADDTLTRAEKDKKITELRQKIIELRN